MTLVKILECHSSLVSSLSLFCKYQTLGSRRLLHIAGNGFMKSSAAHVGHQKMICPQDCKLGERRWMALPHFCETQFSKEEKKGSLLWLVWCPMINQTTNFTKKWLFALKSGIFFQDQDLNLFYGRANFQKFRNVGRNEPDHFTFSSIILPMILRQTFAALHCNSLSIVMTSIIFWEQGIIQ